MTETDHNMTEWFRNMMDIVLFMTDSVFNMTRIYKYMTETDHDMTEIVSATVEKQKMA